MAQFSVPHFGSTSIVVRKKEFQIRSATYFSTCFTNKKRPSLATRIFSTLAIRKNSATHYNELVLTHLTFRK